MSEPTRKGTRRIRPSAADRPAAGEYEPDVLLIADEPRGGAYDWQARTNPRVTGREQPIGPMDMESVVRRLIALLTEESRS